MNEHTHHASDPAEPSPAELRKAFLDGTDAGKLDSTPGNRFRAAWPAAKDHGYKEHTLLRAVFTDAYLKQLPDDGVLTDPTGIVIAELPPTVPVVHHIRMPRQSGARKQAAL